MGPSSGLSYAAGLQGQAQPQGQPGPRRTNDPNDFPALTSPHPSAQQAQAQAFYQHQQVQHHQHQQPPPPQQQQQQQGSVGDAEGGSTPPSLNAGTIAPPHHSQHAPGQPPQPPPPPPPGFDPTTHSQQQHPQHSMHLPHNTHMGALAGGSNGQSVGTLGDAAAAAAASRLKTEDFPALVGGPGEIGAPSPVAAGGVGAGMNGRLGGGMGPGKSIASSGGTIGAVGRGTTGTGSIHASYLGSSSVQQLRQQQQQQQGSPAASGSGSSAAVVNGTSNRPLPTSTSTTSTSTAVGDGAALGPPPGVVGAHNNPHLHALPLQQQAQQPSQQQSQQPHHHQLPQQQQQSAQQQQSPGIVLLKPVHQLVTSPVDKWGLEALLTLIRTGGRDDQLGLQLGDDLMGIGLDMHASGPLYPTFTSPWQEPDSARSTLMVEEEYKIPACYNVQTPAASTKIGQFSDETLFYAFYTCPQDVLQMEVAAELYMRNWRWHKELCVWLTRDPNEQTEQGPGYERGVFYYFDPNRYEKAETPKDFVCQYDRLEDRPEWLGRQDAVAAGVGAGVGAGGQQRGGGGGVGQAVGGATVGTTTLSTGGAGTSLGGGVNQSSSSSSSLQQLPGQQQPTSQHPHHQHQQQQQQQQQQNQQQMTMQPPQAVAQTS